MADKHNLELFLTDIDTRKCSQINLIWSNGEKSGISNPKAIDIAITALRAELVKQINELN